MHQKEIDNERQARAEHDFMAQKLIIKVEELQSRIHNKDFKSEHYDEELCDRQDIEKEVMYLRKENVVLEASLNSKTNENVEIQKEVQSCKQTLALLKQDKEYLNKQLTEVTTKCKVFEEQVIVLNQELGKIKQDREELYEKYISVREKYKSEYEMKLRDELDVITTKTNTELDKIKNNTKEMYERENRNLREARDNALAEKDRAVHAEQQMTSRYEQVFQEYRELQGASDSKVTELHSDLKLKQFELDRLQMLYEETSQSLKQANVDTTKYQHKLEVLNKEFYTLQASTDKQINELQSTNTDATKKLSIYEKLEQELDDVILQAAQLESEVDAERVLFAYGYGANVPSTAKRRMQQSIHLARRVLKLERMNTTLQGQLEDEKRKRDELLQELSNTTNILNEAQQPYNYLIESIRVRDSQIKSLQENNTLLEEDIRKLQQEQDKLAESKNKITADLERLLNQREVLILYV
ncbi:progesterone-induced-blocking factor 1-like [Paramuricea clavata]|uniref:Progesterone-induced-blocking factor 1-like n=1 Tax=Paramuricea clavata TaxID=317549 RepID=A0A6S7HEF1_PARCT|nr:progesterone-induced-blocking factor 1-like [Paramuricea clavata]